ncbi:MAG: peptidylprolyl isomerase [Mariniblastus sp.]
MKTYRILNQRVICFAILLTVIIGGFNFANAQSSQFTETPDPYFNQPVRPRVANNQPVNRPLSNKTSSGVWTAPGKIEASNVPAPIESGSLWNAPRTPVSNTPVNNSTSANNGIASRPSQSFGGGFSGPGVSTPSQPNSTSIIRESQGSAQPQASNNSFGSPQTVNRSATAPENRSFNGTAAMDDNSFGAPQSKPFSAQPFQGQSFQGQSFITKASANVASREAITNDSQSNKREFASTPIGKISPSTARTPVSFDSQVESRPVVIKTEKDESFEPGRVLALVGGQPIFVGDLLFDVNQRIEKVMGSAPESVKAQARKQLLPKLLPQFVDAKIRFIGGLRGLPDGVELEDILEQAGEGFDTNALDEMVKGAGLKSVAELDAHLRVQGASVRKVRRMWCEDQLTRHLLQKQIQIDEDIPHQQMLDDYQKNIAKYAIPAKSKWEQIMIRFDRTGSRAEARKMIEELGNQIVYGASLEAVAKKSSQGFMASAGGQHPATTRGALVLKEIDEAIFTLPVGELSDVIETRDGFHIVRVVERNEATKTPFLEAQVEIKKRLVSEKRESAFKEFMDKLRREIPVEYFTDDVLTQ